MPPAGFKRSRALWDDCWNQNFHRDDTVIHPSILIVLTQYYDIAHRYLRAILYEIQPIRYSILSVNFISSCRTLNRVLLETNVWARRWIPYVAQQSFVIFRNLTWDHWKLIIVIALYYIFLRWIHAMLDAGPVVLIVTILITIFTVGLSDQRDSDGLSAYSVFNKGFQKILGSIDADDLLQQHLGGGGLMQMMNRQGPQWDDENEEPRRRQQNAQRGHNADNHNDEDQVQPPGFNNNQNRARRTGKKARRDRVAIEQRREIRAQRQAAMELGHINDDDLVAELVNRQDIVEVDE